MPSLQPTADGSHTLYSDRFGVPYHSVHGAVTESRHVFIQAGLHPLLASGQPHLRILEMGFGTGLNAYLTLLELDAYPEVTVDYFAYEHYPIPAGQAAELNYPAVLGADPERLSALHAAFADPTLPVSPHWHLRPRQTDFLTDANRPYEPDSIDLIYYDAFAPVSQPEFWEPEAMVVCWEALRPGGRLFTYCAKGQFKRNLRTVGFVVEPLPGPPGKREMTSARKEV